jgi:predicted dithiol-disulfide oxidoreductase (DUF899 family)
MNYAEGSERLAGLRARIAALRQEMRAVQDELTPQPVDDHGFAGPDGPLRLSQLFGDKDDLFVIHNMGAGCRYCTLWADGYNGVYPQLATRAAFVVASPDAPERQQKLAEARGWRFPMVSDQGSRFAAEMGYTDDEGHLLPGVSVLQRRGAAIVRVSEAGFQPYDDFCPVWHLFAMLPGGPGQWTPQPAFAAPKAKAGCCGG